MGIAEHSSTRLFGGAPVMYDLTFALSVLRVDVVEKYSCNDDCADPPVFEKEQERCRLFF